MGEDLRTRVEKALSEADGIVDQTGRLASLKAGGEIKNGPPSPMV